MLIFAKSATESTPHAFSRFSKDGPMPGMPRNGIICTNSACLATGIMSMHPVWHWSKPFWRQACSRDADGTGDVVPSGDLIAYPSSDGAGTSSTAAARRRRSDISHSSTETCSMPIGDAGEHLCEDTSGHLTVVVDVHRQKDAVRA